MSKDEATLGIYIPSYKRAKSCVTHKLVPDGIYVVRKSEEQEYRAAGITKLIAVDDNLIDNVVKVNQWLIDNAKEDVICILDDDIRKFVYRLDNTTDLTDPDLIYSEIARIAQLLLDLDLGFAAVDATSIPYNYVAEFEFKGTAGSTRWVNRKCFKAKLDESVRYNYDIDVVLQELLKNRVVIKPKYLVSCGRTDTNEGGNSSKKRSDQIACIELMKLKWGKYFDYNIKKNKPKIMVKR